VAFSSLPYSIPAHTGQTSGLTQFTGILLKTNTMIPQESCVAAPMLSPQREEESNPHGFFRQYVIAKKTKSLRIYRKPVVRRKRKGQ
jgi:hypothetical protein